MKRYIAVFALVVCLVAPVMQQAQASTGDAYRAQADHISGVRTVSGGIYELSEDGTAVLLEPTSSEITELVVPARVVWAKRAYVVTAVADGACEGCGRLEYVTIGKNVSEIGTDAFKGCDKLLKFTSRTKRVTMRMLEDAGVL